MARQPESAFPEGTARLDCRRRGRCPPGRRKRMPERAHHCSTIAASSPPKSGSFGRMSATRPRRIRGPSGRRAGREVEHRPIDPVEMLADVLDQQIDAGEVRLERVPSRFDRTVRLKAMAGPSSAGSSAAAVTPHEPIERAATAAVAAARTGVLRHRPPGGLETGLMQAGEQESGIAIAKVWLVAAAAGMSASAASAMRFDPYPPRANHIASNDGSAITSRSAARRASSGPAKWPSVRNIVGE